MNEMMVYDLKQATGPTPSRSSQLVRERGRRVVAGRSPPCALIEDGTALAEQVGRSVVGGAVKVLVGKELSEVRRGIGARVRTRAHWGLLGDAGQRLGECLPKRWRPARPMRLKPNCASAPNSDRCRAVTVSRRMRRSRPDENHRNRQPRSRL